MKYKSKVLIFIILIMSSLIFYKIIVKRTQTIAVLFQTK